MIKSFSQFINEDVELNLEKPELEKSIVKSEAELEIVLNVIDKNKNLQELLKFLRSSKTALTIKCIDDESKEEKEFKWSKEDSVLFLDVSDLESDNKEDELEEDLEKESEESE